MYDSIVLRTVARFMLPLLFLLSVFMLIRGHNLPGGGFVGGLLAASAIILQIIAFGPDYARQAIPVSHLQVAATGVVFTALWGLPGLLTGQPYMTAFWLPEPIPGIGKIGTPVLFDIGVYLTVIGVTTQLAFILAEEPLFYPMRKKATPSEPVAPEA